MFVLSEHINNFTHHSHLQTLLSLMPTPPHDTVPTLW